MIKLGILRYRHVHIQSYLIVSHYYYQVGKQFDALLIDTTAPAQFPVFDVFKGDSVEVLVSQQ